MGLESPLAQTRKRCHDGVAGVVVDSAGAVMPFVDVYQPMVLEFAYLLDQLSTEGMRTLRWRKTVDGIVFQHIVIMGVPGSPCWS